MATYDFPKHPKYAAAHAKWSRIRDALAGEQKVKSLGEKYLPKLGGQDAAGYSAYLERAVFFNAAQKTLNGLVGLLLRRPPQVIGLDGSISLKNITRSGQHFLSFVDHAAREVLSVRRLGVLLDKPPRTPGRSSGPSYYETYKAEDILNWRTREINGRVVLDQVLLQETDSVPHPSGIGVVEVTRYRVLELNDLNLYVQRVFTPTISQKRPRQGMTVSPLTVKTYTERVIMPMRNEEPLNFIPFKILGTGLGGADPEKPTLEDIVDINFSHYRSYADLEHGRHYTAMPTYYISGGDKDTYVVGPDHVWNIGENDKIGILEFNGSGLTFLENALATKEDQISALGGRIIGTRRKVAAESGEAASSREMGEQSVLLNAANLLEKDLSDLLTWKSQWDGFDNEVVVEFNKDFSSDGMTSRETRVIQQLAESSIPIELLYRVCQKSDVLQPETSYAEFKAMIESSRKEHDRRMKEQKAPVVQPQPKQQAKPAAN